MRLIEETESDKVEKKKEIAYEIFEAILQLIVYTVMAVIVVHTIISSVENITSHAESISADYVGTIEDMFIEKDNSVNKYVAIINIRENSYTTYIKQDDFLKYRIGDTVLLHGRNQNYSITDKIP